LIDIFNALMKIGFRFAAVLSNPLKARLMKLQRQPSN